MGTSHSCGYVVFHSEEKALRKEVFCDHSDFVIIVLIIVANSASGNEPGILTFDRAFGGPQRFKINEKISYAGTCFDRTRLFSLLQNCR